MISLYDTSSQDSATGLPPWLSKVNLKPNKDFKFVMPAKPDPTSTGGTGTVVTKPEPVKPIDNSSMNFTLY